MSRTFLRRYTDIPSALDVITNKRLTLLTQASWDDKNDLFCIAKYKELKNLKTLLSLCMTTHGLNENGEFEQETYHHWKNFSSGGSGTCIQFNKELLIKCIKKPFKHKDVKYTNSLSDQKIELDELPFLKRDVFTAEREYRIIYEDKEKKQNFKHLDIDLKCIESIRLSPWMPEPLFKSTKAAFKAISPTTKISKSKLIDFEGWQQKVLKNLEF